MKKFLTVIALLTSVSALAENHYPARNCEIFVDKVSSFYSSHGSIFLKFYIKTLNQRLDGAIKEVGFRYQTRNAMNGQIVEAWRNLPAGNFVGAQDYFTYTTPAIAHDWGSYEIDGAFYVRTDKDTYYWLKPDMFRDDLNFKINAELFRSINQRNPWGYDGSLSSAIPTQDGSLPYFNPGNCR